MKAAFAALLLVAGKALQDGARMSGHEKHPHQAAISWHFEATRFRMC